MTKSSLSHRESDLEQRGSRSVSSSSGITREQLVARANLRFQKEMVNKFREIRDSSGLSPEDLADHLGATKDMIEAIENFEYDLSLTEIRHLAIALNAIVEVQVHISTAEEYVKTANQHLAELLDVGKLWQQSHSIGESHFNEVRKLQWSWLQSVREF